MTSKLVERAREHALDMATSAIASGLVSSTTRIAILRRLGSTIGPGTHLRTGLRVSRARELMLGTDVFCNVDCVLEATYGIRIGDHVSIGRRAALITTGHAIGPSEHRAGKVVPGAITVGDGSWLGAGVLVLPGVTVGSGVVVGAGSVVITDLEDDALYVGVPARRVRSLDRTGTLTT